MSSVGAAPRAAVPASNVRAEASRKNGARSRGPKTPEGKTRSAQNALKHGLRAQKYVVLPEEDAAAFAALEAALVEELAPVGALQSVLVRRIAVAAWRLERAERLEVEVFAHRRYGDCSPGLALIRDTNGSRAFDTLLRYRGAALAELWRALRTLKALQAEQAATPLRATKRAPAPVLMFEPRRGRADTSIEQVPDQGGAARPAAREKHPIEPEARANPGESEPAPPADNPEPPAAGPARARPSEPEPAPAALPAPLQRDLDETMRIAGRSEMRISQCDVHLEHARLALAEGNREKARRTRRRGRGGLVNETGCGRRRPEVEALETEIL